MVVGMSSNVFANEGNDINLDNILAQRGYPQIVLDTIDEDVKLDIYNDDVTFCGAIVSHYNESSGEFTDISVNKDGTYIMPRG